MSRKLLWPELPRSRGEIDHVHSLLMEWAEWADLGYETAEDEGASSLGSIVHILECALLLWLAPYAKKRGFESTIFINSNAFDLVCNRMVFDNGYPLEMAEALSTCYAFERPWEIASSAAKEYANKLTGQLKNLALYHIESAEFWKEKFDGGGKPGRISLLKKYVAGVVNGSLKKPNKSLWEVLCKAVADKPDGAIPLSYDDVDKTLFETKKNTEYTFERFTKHMAELRNPKS